LNNAAWIHNFQDGCIGYCQQTAGRRAPAGQAVIYTQVIAHARALVDELARGALFWKVPGL
jgi:hypothetical protein